MSTYNPPGTGNINKKASNELSIAKENDTLRKEVAFLDNINFRLGKELVDLQIKFNQHPSSGPRPFRGGDDDVLGGVGTGNNRDHYISNIASSDRELSFLEPLLIAYDTKMENMERIIESTYEELRDLDKKSEILVTENNRLRELLESKAKIIQSMQNQGTPADHLNTTFLKLERNDLNERISILSDENQELFSKFQEISIKYSELKHRCEDQSNGSEDSLRQLLEMSTKCKVLEVECVQIRNSKEVLEDRVRQNVETIAILEGEKADIGSKLSRTENELKILKTQLGNFKRNSTDLEDRKNMESDHLRREIDALKLRDRDACQKQVSAEKELDYLKDESRKLIKEREVMKQELEQMIRMMDNYQSKISSLESKEESLAKQAKDARDKLQEALLQRDKAILSEQQLEKSLQVQAQTSRSELEEIREQHSRFVENLKNKQKNVLAERDDEIEELTKQVTSAIFVKEKLQKENTTLLQEQKKFSVSLKDEYSGGKVNEKVPEYERRITELEEKLQLTEQYNSDRLHSLSMEKAQVETTYRNQQNIVSDLKASNERLRGETSKLTQEIAQQNSRISSMSKDKQAAIDEIAKIKRGYENKFDQVSSQFTYKMKDAQEALNESIKRERISREKAIELLQTHDRIEEKMKYEYEQKIKELELIAITLKDENKGLMLKCKKIFDDGSKTLQK